MQFYAIPCNIIQYLTLREHLCPSARCHFNPLKKISHLFIRFCAMDQYSSPYRDLQKKSWSKGRRCRYWAVSDVSLSKPVPKVKRWLIVEHSFVFFLQGNSSWCLLLLSNFRIGWFIFTSVDTRPSKSGKYLVFLANILPGSILNITDWITTLSLKIYTCSSVQI